MAIRHLETEGCSALMVDSGRDFKHVHSITTWHLVSPLWVDATTAQDSKLLPSLHASWALQRRGPALSMPLSCSQAFCGSLVLCEIKSKLLSLAFSALPDLAPGQCLFSSATTSLCSL